MKFDMLIRNLPNYPSMKSSIRRWTIASMLSAGLISPAISQTCSPTGCKGPNLVVNGNFEQAINNPANPVNGFTTEYGYVSCPVNHPSDLWGNIAIMTNPNICYNLWSSTDHTYGDGTGYMMLVDFPDSNPNGTSDFMDIWATDVAVTAGNTYCFGAWYKNMNTNNNVPKPKFRYMVDSTLLGTSSELASNGQWVYYGFQYTVPVGTDTVNIAIQNGKWGGNGNDLAIDDIEFREVGAGNAMPVAMNDSELVPNSSANYPIQILQNDTINVPSALAVNAVVSLITTPATSVGTVTIAPDNSLQFTPAVGVSDTTVQFVYELCQTGSGCCSEAVVTVQISSPLSAEVHSLDVVADHGTSLLSWNTTQEFGNSHFVIERSVNRVDFEAIGEVDGNGTTDQLRNYEFTDYQVMQLGVKNSLLPFAAG